MAAGFRIFGGDAADCRSVQLQQAGIYEVMQQTVVLPNLIY